MVGKSSHKHDLETPAKLWIEDVPMDRVRVDVCTSCGALVPDGSYQGFAFKDTHLVVCPGRRIR